MRRVLAWVFVAVACFTLGLLGARALWLPAPKPSPDPPTVVQQMREAARLTTLEVSLYKKVTFAPDPQPQASLWGELVEWARYSVRPPQGKVIVFADVHLGLDLGLLDERSMRIQGRRIDVVLPPLVAKVELRPGETEVIGSNLDSAQTAELFERAKAAFEQDALGSQPLRDRARASAERVLGGLLFSLGFEDVRFVDALPATSPAL